MLELAGAAFQAAGGLKSIGGGKAPKMSSSRSYAYSNSSFAPVTYMTAGKNSTALIVIGIAVLFVFFKLLVKKKR